MNLRIGCKMPGARVKAFVLIFALSYKIFYMFGALVQPRSAAKVFACSAIFEFFSVWDSHFISLSDLLKYRLPKCNLLEMNYKGFVYHLAREDVTLISSFIA